MIPGVQKYGSDLTPYQASAQNSAGGDRSRPDDVRPAIAPAPKVEGVASRRARKDAMGLTQKERQRLEALRRRDQQVRLHEQLHIAKAEGLTRGGPRYTLVKGPDGQMYAIGGHVHIDTRPEKTPEETVEKAKKIQRAATAPGDPSPQDMKVAARAIAMEHLARGQMAAQSQKDRESERSEKGPSAADASVGAEADEERTSASIPPVDRTSPFDHSGSPEKTVFGIA